MGLYGGRRGWGADDFFAVVEFGEAVIKGFGGFFKEERFFIFVDSDNRFHGFHIQQGEGIVFLKGNGIQVELVGPVLLNVREPAGGLQYA